MRVSEKQGDLFASEGPLGHGCNVMGAYAAGVAGLVREKYPYAYEEYRSAVNNNRYFPGMAQFCFPSPVKSGRMVINMATQVFPGKHADLNLIEFSMNQALQGIEMYGGPQVLNIPFLGCGIGGLTWDVVQPVIQEVADEFPQIEVVAWYL